ncbi:MAG: hypothetical protein GX640_01245, partial [Fibrobacter sp.]|nr:hypothetical protein [Fibrobacter sp.]
MVKSYATERYIDIVTTFYKRARIVSVGSYVPETVLTNKDLEKIVDTTDLWIEQRTGIKSRRIIPKDQPVPASDLGTKAAMVALE